MLLASFSARIIFAFIIFLEESYKTKADIQKITTS